MFQTLRWPRGDRSRCGDGILLVSSDERRRLTPARKASEGIAMPVSDPSAFTGGELLTAVDELCQDFIWSSPNRLYPVQAPDGLCSTEPDQPYRAGWSASPAKVGLAVRIPPPLPFVPASLHRNLAGRMNWRWIIS